MVAVVWLIVGVILVIAEVFSGDFVLVMLGGSAIFAALASALHANLIISAIVFVALSVGGIILARPALKRKLHVFDHTATNTAALLGKKATVMSRVDAHHGQVKIGGELWSARAYDEAQVLEPGKIVTVMEISGATAVVWDGP